MSLEQRYSRRAVIRTGAALFARALIPANSFREVAKPSPKPVAQWAHSRSGLHGPAVPDEGNKVKQIISDLTATGSYQYNAIDPSEIALQQLPSHVKLNVRHILPGNIFNSDYEKTVLRPGLKKLKAGTPVRFANEPNKLGENGGRYVSARDHIEQVFIPGGNVVAQFHCDPTLTPTAQNAPTPQESEEEYFVEMIKTVKEIHPSWLNRLRIGMNVYLTNPKENPLERVDRLYQLAVDVLEWMPPLDLNEFGVLQNKDIQFSDEEVAFYLEEMLNTRHTVQEQVETKTIWLMGDNYYRKDGSSGPFERQALRRKTEDGGSEETIVFQMLRSRAE